MGLIQTRYHTKSSQVASYYGIKIRPNVDSKLQQMLGMLNLVRTHNSIAPKISKSSINDYKRIVSIYTLIHSKSNQSYPKTQCLNIRT